MTSQKSHPNRDEVEVSLFGPGFGECVVVHLGNGKWFVVDSCCTRKSGEDIPIALEYLRGIGVNVAEDVELFVVSHWHDDHIKGAARFLEDAKKAKFICSAALNNKEFITLLELCENIELIEHSNGVAEFSKILRVLKSRERIGPDFWASAGLQIFHSNTPYEVTVHALSPSARVVTEANIAFGQLLPQVGSQMKPRKGTSPNKHSIVLLIKIDSLSILLGADLETGVAKDVGWGAVISLENVPLGRSQAYKVAHHGSNNADHEGVWCNLLEDNPFAILTPFTRLPEPLPTPIDLDRIRKNSKKAYCTKLPPYDQPIRRTGAVEASIRQVVRNRKAIPRVPGQVRIRWAKVGGRWGEDGSVALFDGAKPI